MTQTRPVRPRGRGGSTHEGSVVPGGNSCANNSQETTNCDVDTNNSGSQRSNGQFSNTTGGQTQKRGRKKKAKTELKMPPRSGKILLEPGNDKQFKYIPNNIRKEYTYPAQLGVILKHEYPGLVKEKDVDGNVVATRAASSWHDYYLSPDDAGMTPVDRVKREFWHLFEVREDDKVKANDLLESYCVDRVRQQMYSARVDAVKEYYSKQGEDLDDTLACPLELEYEQYLEGMVWWCKEDAWKHLCRNWSSKEFIKKRKLGQDSRLKSKDVAQNRGGSRPFTTTQQYLEHKFGPENATELKTYAVMKSGMKNVDVDGNCGPINSKKAQKRIDDYSAAARVEYPDDWEQRPFDEAILYNINGGLPHGRVPMGVGAVSKAKVLATARARNIRPSSSSSYRHVIHENQELREEAAYNRQLILRLFEKLGEQPPPMKRCGDGPAEEQEETMLFKKLDEQPPPLKRCGEASTEEQETTSTTHMAKPDDNINEDVENRNVDTGGSNNSQGTE